MRPESKRTFKSALWRPAWIAGSFYLGAIAFVASLKDVFDWFDETIAFLHAHPLGVVLVGALTIVGNILYTDNRYHERQRELEAIRRRSRFRRR